MLSELDKGYIGQNPEASRDMRTLTKPEPPEWWNRPAKEASPARSPLTTSALILRASSLRRSKQFRLGHGWRARATRETNTRYRISASKRRHSPITSRVETCCHDGRLRLACAGCNQHSTAEHTRLYLSNEKDWRCRSCLGLRKPPKKPPRLLRKRTYRNLLRRQIDGDILEFESAAMRTLTPKEFFASRPYLVPEWVDGMRKLDRALHREMLMQLHAVYIVLLKKGRRGRRPLTQREFEMLFGEIDRRRKLKRPISPPDAAAGGHNLKLNPSNRCCQKSPQSSFPEQHF